MKELNTLPNIIGENIIIRPIRIKDCNEMYEYAKLSNVGRYY